MASVTYGNAVFGARDLKITNIGGTTQEDAGSFSMMGVKPVLKSGLLEGDDVGKAVAAHASHAEVEFSFGQISSAALAIMTGRTLTTAGSTPNETTLLKVSAGDAMPYFKIYGKSLDEGSGDLHLYVHKMKLTELDAHKLENGNWTVVKAKGFAIDDGTNGIYQLKQFETAANVPSS